MESLIFRVFIEKKEGFDIEAQALFRDVKESLNIVELKGVRLLNRYDVEGINEEDFEKACTVVFSEPNADKTYIENINIQEKHFVVEYLPGQYDQRADSAEQCIQILTGKEDIRVKTARVIVLEGNLSEEDVESVKAYYINYLDSRETTMDKPLTLKMDNLTPEKVKVLEGFTSKSKEELEKIIIEEGLAMNIDDLVFTQSHFRAEKRNPTITELKLVDTYWSDHCRHTTFQTVIDDVEFKEGNYVEEVKKAYELYLDTRKSVYGEKYKPQCLMDIAVIGMKELKRIGKLDNLDSSDEINACSIVVKANVNGEEQEWLVMFKNETHNHPTEIEPFGGASTCLGGAIRDPLSGRSYVYQAMRVTGSADPRKSLEETLPGKLPQKKITKGAAKGYSSYGNQIGLATGFVDEIYHEGYLAKRMEVGAVIGATPRENVVRRAPIAGDKIVLLGGRTGRDGVGGASGSSKEHTEDSLSSCGAEVQKGNAPTERKIQRLFRKKEVTELIVKCNDFGAGGVSVAIGELADGLVIDLNKVPKKYDGLDGTELAISESQERMAVVIPKEKVQLFINEAEKENLEAVIVAEVTDNGRLVMRWNEDVIVDLSREFLDTNGVTQHMELVVASPDNKSYYEVKKENYESKSLKELWIDNMASLNVCSKKGLVEMFDSSVGASNITMPFGGKYQNTPVEAMVSKLPILRGDTTTGTIMAYGFNPELSSWSPFHGAINAVIESAAKIVAVGGDYRDIRLSFQEYFEKLGRDKEKWGKPFVALLGALKAQLELGIAAIGGKDSMSGTFKEINVPPTLISFAVAPVDVRNVITPEFKKVGSKIVFVGSILDEKFMPNFDVLKKNFEIITKLIKKGAVLSAHTVKVGGISEALTKMSMGNRIGFSINENRVEELFASKYGSLILEIENYKEEIFEGIAHKTLGETIEEYTAVIENEVIELENVEKIWSGTLESIFPTKYKKSINEEVKIEEFNAANKYTINGINKIAKPKVLIPVFPGTNCEYDLAKSFENAGAEVETFVFNNMNPSNIEQSINKMSSIINNSQIIMIPGGFSAGDEPDGSAKFIATIFRNKKIEEAVMNLLNNRDGLMLGICNGFQALIKLGLVPFGEIREINENCPTLTHNKIGRHAATMVRTKIMSNNSPWLNEVKVGDIHNIPLSHGEGRFVANEETMKQLMANGQIITTYVDLNGNPTMDERFNPNGSMGAVEGIVSPDGRVLGKMAHSERIGKNLYKNIYGETDQKLFISGVRYFK